MRGLLLIVGIFLAGGGYAQGEYRIVISKRDLLLYVVNTQYEVVLVAPIAAGKHYGDKQCKGDMKTPEGTFYISQIQNSTRWEHDFHDGTGSRKGAYGPWFFRLRLPAGNIGGGGDWHSRHLLP